MSRALAFFLVPTLAMGQGIGLGVWVDAIDVSEVKAHLFGMAEDSLVLADLVTAVPDSLPFPLVGGFVSLPMASGALEMEVAFLTDGIIRALGIWPKVAGLGRVRPPVLRR